MPGQIGLCCCFKQGIYSWYGESLITRPPHTAVCNNPELNEYDTRLFGLAPIVVMPWMFRTYTPQGKNDGTGACVSNNSVYGGIIWCSIGIEADDWDGTLIWHEDLANQREIYAMRFGVPSVLTTARAPIGNPNYPFGRQDGEPDSHVSVQWLVVPNTPFKVGLLPGSEDFVTKVSSETAWSFIDFGYPSERILEVTDDKYFYYQGAASYHNATGPPNEAPLNGAYWRFRGDESGEEEDRGIIIHNGRPNYDPDAYGGGFDIEDPGTWPPSADWLQLQHISNGITPIPIYARWLNYWDPQPQDWEPETSYAVDELVTHGGPGDVYSAFEASDGTELEWIPANWDKVDWDQSFHYGGVSLQLPVRISSNFQGFKTLDLKGVQGITATEIGNPIIDASPASVSNPISIEVHGPLREEQVLEFDQFFALNDGNQDGKLVVWDPVKKQTLSEGFVTGSGEAYRALGWNPPNYIPNPGADWFQLQYNTGGADCMIYPAVKPGVDNCTGAREYACGQNLSFKIISTRDIMFVNASLWWDSNLCPNGREKHHINVKTWTATPNGIQYLERQSNVIPGNQGSSEHLYWEPIPMPTRICDVDPDFCQDTSQYDTLIGTKLYTGISNYGSVSYTNLGNYVDSYTLGPPYNCGVSDTVSYVLRHVRTEPIPQRQSTRGNWFCGVSRRYVEWVNGTTGSSFIGGLPHSQCELAHNALRDNPYNQVFPSAEGFTYHHYHDIVLCKARVGTGSQRTEYDDNHILNYPICPSGSLVTERPELQFDVKEVIATHGFSFGGEGAPNTRFKMLEVQQGIDYGNYHTSLNWSEIVAFDANSSGQHILVLNRITRNPGQYYHPNPYNGVWSSFFPEHRVPDCEYHYVYDDITGYLSIYVNGFGRRGIVKQFRYLRDALRPGNCGHSLGNPFSDPPDNTQPNTDGYPDSSNSTGQFNEETIGGYSGLYLVETLVAPSGVNRAYLTYNDEPDIDVDDCGVPLHIIPTIDFNGEWPPGTPFTPDDVEHDIYYQQIGTPTNPDTLKFERFTLRAFASTASSWQTPKSGWLLTGSDSGTQGNHPQLYRIVMEHASERFMYIYGFPLSPLDLHNAGFKFTNDFTPKGWDKSAMGTYVPEGNVDPMIPGDPYVAPNWSHYRHSGVDEGKWPNWAFTHDGKYAIPIGYRVEDEKGNLTMDGSFDYEPYRGPTGISYDCIQHESQWPQEIVHHHPDSKEFAGEVDV